MQNRVIMDRRRAVFEVSSRYWKTVEVEQRWRFDSPSQRSCLQQGHAKVHERIP